MTLQPDDRLGEQFLLLDTCFQGGQPRAFGLEMTYFTELVALFADMCVGRNFTCSNEIRVRFPIGTLLEHLWNEELALTLRAAFARLLQSLYVDAYPREETKKPTLCRTLEHLGASLNNARQEVQRKHSLTRADNPSRDLSFQDGHKFPTSRRPSLMDSAHLLLTNEHPSANESVEMIIGEDEETLFQLKEDILGYLEQNNDAEQVNELHVCVLRLAHQMMRFELFGTCCTYMQERKCVLSPRHSEYIGEYTDLARLARAVKPLLEVKKVNKVASSKRRPQSIYNTVLAQVLKDPTSMSDSVVRASVATKNLLNSYSFEAEEMHPYDLPVQQEVIEMYHYILDCRQDCLVNNALEWFLHKGTQSDALELIPPIMPCTRLKSTNTQAVVKPSKSTFRSYSQVLVGDLDELLGCDATFVKDLLIYLVHCTDFEQETKLLHLLYRCYHQRGEMLNTLSSIYVVSRTDDMQVFQWLKLVLPRFKQQAEESEIWLKYWQQTGLLRRHSEETIMAVTQTIKQLQDLLLKGTIIQEQQPQEFEGRGLISEVRQTMLFYLDVHTLVINLIRDGMSSLEELTRSGDSSASALTLLFSHCHNFLKRFVEDNSRNQSVLFKHMHLFRSNLTLDAGQIPLIAAIYRNNLNLCLQVTEESLQPFVQAIREVGRKPRFLEVFSAVQVVGEKSLPTVQNVVLKVLMGHGSVQLLYLDPSHPSEFLFEPAPGKDDQPFEYHAALLKVLASCGWGSDQVYLNEAKLQKFLSLETVFRLLQKSENQSQLDAEKWGLLRLPLLEFFFHVYLEAQRRTEELVGNAEFLTYVKTQTQHLYTLDTATDSYVQFFGLMLRILLVYARDYISHDEEELFQDEESISVLKAFALAFERNAKKFESVLIPENVQKQMEEFIRIFSIPIDGEWIKTLKSIKEPSHAEDQAMIQWAEFQRNLSHNEQLQEAVDDEKQYYLKLLAKANKLDSSLSFSAVMHKYITYLSLATLYRPPLKVFQECLEVLRGCITSVRLKRKETSEEAMKRIQDELASYNLCSEILGLLCYHEFLQEQFHAVLMLAIDMLLGGNTRVQSEFHLYFINVPSGELFFQRLHILLFQEIELLNSTEIRNPSQYLLSMLRFLQLLCEGHNQDMQMYLRQQTHSRRSYDLVSLCVTLLSALVKRLRSSDFLQTSQCFDTLTEFIQGPCKENQETIIAGAFLDAAVRLLSLDENSNELKPYAALEAQAAPSSNSAPLSGWMVAHLKYKCMITVHSLLEGHTDALIITRLMRALHIELLKTNIFWFFNRFEQRYLPEFYDEEIFGHADLDEYHPEALTSSQAKDPGYHQLVAETPFMIFHLMKKFHDSADPDQRQRIQAELPVLAYKETGSSFLAVRLIENFSKLGVGLLKEGTARVKKVSRAVTGRVHPEPIAEEMKDTMDRVYKFLEAHTCNIEVVFNGTLCRVYFLMPPYASVLSEEMKEVFHSHADRSSEKAKLMYLLDRTSDIELQLRCEYALQKFVSKHWTVALVANSIGLWKDLGFLLTLVLNLLILFSFSVYGTDRLNEPSFFYYARDGGHGLSVNETKALFIILGVMQIMCTFFVVLSFLAKNAPVLAVHGWNRIHSTLEKPTRFQNVMHIAKKTFWVLVYVFSNGAVLYYLGCIVLSILGTTVTPLFFAFHLMEVVLRYSSLQQVVQAVIVPWQSTVLTYFLLLICTYYFGIIGYAYFSSYFSASGDDLLHSVISVYDVGFKSNGGIGGGLPDWTGTLNIARVFYDDANNVIVMLIILNMWVGITKDAFTSLREKHEDNVSDRENLCFICGMDKETIERVTKRPLKMHATFEHNEWSYIMFICYLKGKDPTEFTGVESFVWEQYKKKDIQWFPQHQALEIKADSSIDDEIRVRREQVNKKLKKVNSVLSIVRQNTYKDRAAT